VVTDVTPDGPAWEVLRPADSGAAPDIIMSVEGKPVSTEADLRAALRHPGPEGIVSLEVFTPSSDGGVRQIIRLKLSAK
jgi:S1-C subfamily serine protease